MKSLAVGLLVLALSPSGAAFAKSADDCPNVTINGGCCNAPTRWGERWDAGDARRSITTQDGSVTLLIDDRDVALQLSDRAMHRIGRKLRSETEEADENPIGQALKDAVLTVVRSMLDHSIDCRVRDLRSVDYRDGRLELVTNGGDRLYEKIEVDGRDVLESFSPSDARDFVSEFQRVKHRR